MSEVELIADQIASGYREGAWPGVSVRALLRELSPAQAAAHPIAGAHGAWEIALHAHGALVDAVRVLAPGKLTQVVPGRAFTVYFMLHGVPQHDLYHGGQVMFLSKAMRAGSGVSA